MATFLFLHGAFQGGWVWQRTSALLRSHGHDVHTPTLSGCGNLSRQSHAQDVLCYIEDEGLTDIILVMHDFAGLVGGAVMMEIPKRIRHAIFIDAVIPEYGASFAEMAGASLCGRLERQRLADGLVSPWPLDYFGISEADADWFLSRLRGFPYLAFTMPFSEAFDPHILPVSYFCCQTNQLPLFKNMATKAQSLSWQVERLSTGHSPMVTAPLELVQKMLLTAASRYDVVSFFEGY
jgi:pimeloyl-ACP methyl ester carboxylesterase